MREVKQISVTDESHQGPTPSDEPPRAAENLTDISGAINHCDDIFPDLITLCFLFRLRSCHLMRRSRYNKTLIKTNVSSLSLLSSWWWGRWWMWW